MSEALIIELASFALLVWAGVAAWLWPAAASRRAFGLAIIALLAATAAAIIELRVRGWYGNLAFTLKAIVLATLLAYVVLGGLSQRIRQLGVLLLPYLILFGVLAVIVGLLISARPVEAVSSPGWYDAHIIFALATYALLTLAAMAGLACLIQEAALKRKATGGLSARLPAVAESEQAEIRLLAGAEIVLGIGIATGMSLAWLQEREALPFDHKTILVVAAFLVIGALLLAHGRFGYRGRRAARWVMVAWLLLTLAYPGVKFVREFLLA